MPWSTKFSGSGVDCLFTGATDGSEVAAANNEILGHSYDDHLCYAIVDFSGTESVDLATVDLLRIAEGDRQYLLRNPPYVLAMIAPQGQMYGHARMFERFMEGSSLKSAVVQKRDAALQWVRDQGIEIQET